MRPCERLDLGWPVEPASLVRKELFACFKEVSRKILLKKREIDIQENQASASSDERISNNNNSDE